jgi:flagellar export protein FliJ
MTAARRERRAIEQLLRLAKLRADELKAHLGDVEAAKRSSEASLGWLAEAVRVEEAGTAGSLAAHVDFQRFLEGADVKRKALEATRDRLADEIQSVSAALAEATVEVKKLEHLLEVKAAAAAKANAKAEAAALDDEGLRRSRISGS